MKIYNIKLYGYQDIYNQVITGNSIVKVTFSLEDYYDNTEILIDASNYSNKKIYRVFSKEQEGNLAYFEEMIQVNFLGLNGLCCGKNSEDSRIKILMNGEKYLSNPIGDYLYTEDYVNPNSNFYLEGDHHLGVYNQFEKNFKEETRRISEMDSYPNDIVFIDRNERNIRMFINLELDINQILERYIGNLRIGKKSIFYIEIFSHQSGFFIDKINKLSNFLREGTFFFYNLPLCIFKNLGKDFIEKYILYNHHFKPVLRKKSGLNSGCDGCKYNTLCNGLECNSPFLVNPF
ncbi:MAG: hypothetical protein WC774_00290 [Candidatus Gracilibacteria bacterium]